MNGNSNRTPQKCKKEFGKRELFLIYQKKPTGYAGVAKKALASSIKNIYLGGKNELLKTCGMSAWILRR